MKFGIFGAGSWGTALAWLLGNNNHEAWLLGANSSEMSQMARTRVNQKYFPRVQLPDSIQFGVIGEVELNVDYWIYVAPSSAAKTLFPLFPEDGKPIFLASKGLAQPEGMLLSELMEQIWPGRAVGVVSGPNLAQEVVNQIPTATICACADVDHAKHMGDALRSLHFRPYHAEDVIGVELAGALKNVLAIGAGISDGLKFGDNTKATLLTRGLAEMVKLGTAMGASAETFYGLAGVGDLFATANSKLSRNYRVGFGVGSGRSVQEMISEIGQVAEGVPTSACIGALADKFSLELPCHETIHRVLHGELTPIKGVELLMSREPQAEVFPSGASSA